MIKRIICGDLIHTQPQSLRNEESESLCGYLFYFIFYFIFYFYFYFRDEKQRQKELKAFKQTIVDGINKEIPLICVCGNHGKKKN